MTQKIEKNNNNFFETIIEGKYRHYIMIAVLFIILSSTFFKVAFAGYAPASGDESQWRSSAEVLKNYNEEQSDKAMWNSNVFSGMPSYLISFGAKYPFIGDLRLLTNKIMNWRILLLFTAGLGIYFLMLFYKFDPLIALISAIAFALSCHFIGLLEIGHNTKFRAIMYIPWIILSLEYLRDKRSVLTAGLLALFLIGQLRENHPQISYYTFIMIGIFWIFRLVQAIKEKEVKDHIFFSLILAGVLIISAMAVLNPYLSTLEYSKFTIRGGATGLEKGYAQGWSFHPLEMMSFMNPGVFGGVSPLYWGWMSFTQTSMYMGILIFILALFAFVFSKERTVKILMSVTIVGLLFSFGKYFPLLSDLLLKYFPAFNKFRVPAMILVIVQFAVAIAAGFGIRLLIEKYNNDNKKFFDVLQKIMYGLIVLFIIFILAGSIFDNLSFIKASDAQQYEPSQLRQLKAMRAEKFMNDGIHGFIFLILGIAAAVGFGKKKIGKHLFLIIIAVLVTTDLVIIDKRFLGNLQKEDTIARTYKKSMTDKYLLQDKENFRIYPLGREFGQNSWSYNHQTIGGYHGAKLKRYQEIIENCLNVEFQNRVPINWNIVNMLNSKYVLFNRKLPLENLQYMYHDKKKKITIYKNNDYLSRAWFVENTLVLGDKSEIWNTLNSPNFNPKQTAILETEIEKISPPQTSNIKQTIFDLHKMSFEVETDTTSFLVVSEIYYPAGWNAYLDGEKIEIHPTNYILRGVVIPKGAHTLEMKLEPESYAISTRLSLIGILLTVLLILVGAFLYYRKHYRGEIVYKLKE